MANVVINENGWTCLQEADSERHILEVSCRAEDGMVKEVRVRHNDGEEMVAKVTIDGKPALPMPVKEFKKYYDKEKLEVQ